MWLNYCAAEHLPQAIVRAVFVYMFEFQCSKLPITFSYLLRLKFLSLMQSRCQYMIFSCPFYWFMSTLPFKQKTRRYTVLSSPVSIGNLSFIGFLHTLCSCYCMVSSAIWEIFSEFLIFFNLFQEPLGKWNNSKIWETRKIFTNIARGSVW